MRLAQSLLVGMVVLGFASVAEAKSARYLSKHPLSPRQGGGFCFIDVPHVHAFAPGDPRLYRVDDGAYYFVGDPKPFGYDEPTYAYYGPHPIVEDDVPFDTPIYCYLEGPHYHWYQPPPSTPFELKAGVYWYVGNFDPAF